MKKFDFWVIMTAVFCLGLVSCGPKIKESPFEKTNYASVTVEGSGKYGVKNTATDYEILPQIYDAVGYYYSGFFWAQDSTGVQLFDVNGKCIIPAQTQINAKDGYFEFVGHNASGGVSKGVYFIETEKIVCGVFDALNVDQAGNVIFFQNGHYGVINPEGTTIIPGEYKQLFWDGENYNAIKDKNAKRPYFDEKTKKINWSRAEACTFDENGKLVKKLTASQAKKIFETKI